MYIPSPADTSGIVLDDELSALIEKLAENVHDVWAENRLKDGWKYGPERNDQLKLHPCLVPYSELPEREKDYDRDTAAGTLRLIISLGFNITKKESADNEA